MAKFASKVTFCEVRSAINLVNGPPRVKMVKLVVAKRVIEAVSIAPGPSALLLKHPCYAKRSQYVHLLLVDFALSDQSGQLVAFLVLREPPGPRHRDPDRSQLHLNFV